MKILWPTGEPIAYVTKNGEYMLATSMVLSTLALCMAMTFLPQLAPVWMAWVTDTWV